MPQIKTLAPLIGFIALVGLFFYALFSGDPSKLPSPLIGKPVPNFELSPIEKLERDGAPVKGFSHQDLAKGKISIVNIWASWCVTCRAEHPHLVSLARQSNARLFGINYRDQAVAARRFLGTHGNPYRAIGIDPKGRAAIDWGVYGVPETFLIDGQGIVFYKHVGPLTKESIDERLLPAIKKARRSP